jgi:hypothetical protein
MGDQSPYNITTDLAGRVECEHLKATRNPDKDNCQTYNNDGRDFWCYRRKSCAEQTPSYPQEYKYQYGVEGSGHNLDQYVFIPEPTGTIGGPHGYRCGIYKKQNRSWWQAVQANVYAAQHISNSSEHYVIKSTPTAICTGSQTPAAGLQQTGGGNVGGVSNYWTQRPASNTSAVNAFKVANDDLPDFNFFRQLYPKYNGIPSNGCLLDTDGYTICRYQDQRMSTLASTITSKYVVFIENDLIMDAPTPPLASNDFRAFIVGNKITFHDNIGKNSISANGCGPTDPAISCTNSQLQGIFVADAYEIPTHTDGIPTEILDFNPSVTCDQQTDVTGILISTNDLKLNQSVAGCQLNVGDLNYPNYNETKPVHTFCYHPNLLLQTPEWMKNTLDIRLETL